MNRILLGVLAMTCASACAQTSTITVQSNLVLVPTLVQDSKGGVLYGLKAPQFVLKDSGFPGVGLEPSASPFDLARPISLDPNPLTALGERTAIELSVTEPTILQFSLSVAEFA